ncbi:F-box/LRR-repeat protein At3g03360-like [Rhododendron vialii]|uniref:F-box/LRR-repeat protein At3g03360-like n=1 Tax=Rhododendron vialii TaxID=182163 RepID=UPI00265D740A|nr:F-box/LRR-repeat protein At3g03360-like [Rhododendron vialii]XP_058182174.1 F-box/LRR-repeat protein At3g03360-like [Rhododendron vialii]XP_058182175.1 F-box/LRR-repeat protein At3g03360-like [Rhododendron vialii]XP_058182176.1 F-box/LRR-repeat protein At3g03360-like [Rhododendron vialii]XP_058182177.1 F-box/LRR-repeat protein At3g03360-like [Rhododendron vialii]XP_058182178.1 F-box/LRR-repeat protein At3g03360-like [Rhododendron vialii]XP_058182179.1 F-box/LRR-repeat protein At3g03360-lik
MAGCAAENEQKKQLTAIDILGERRKRGPLFYCPCKVAKLEHSGQDKEELRGEDRISQLPQDILVAILSRLTLQEAGRTSVLSNKWRYLWTFITRRLNFDAWKSVLNSDLSRGVRINSFTYASWVNQVLKHHQSPFIDEFIICFCLDHHFYHHVDSWIKFAFGKGVKRFELNLLNDGPLDCRPSYKFPSLEKFQSSSNTVQGMQLYGHATRAVGSIGFSSLTTLRLTYVNVTDKIIENFLGNCPLLEELHVVWSKRLRNLKVVGISLKLKSLEISNCISLRGLEICAINLVSFSYTGQRIRLLLTNVPVLSKFSTAGDYCQHLMYKDHMDSSYLQQLERLKMKFVSEVFKASISFTQEFTKLCRLKQLELEIWAELGDSLVIYTCLIKACPSLSRFAMRYTRARLYHFEESSTSSGEVRLNVVEEARVQASTRFQHQCLKVVELAGFIGHAEDLELASHLLEIAVSLDKLVINPRNPYFLDNPDIPMKSEDLERGRKCARLLETKLPPKASLVVL